MSDDKPGGEEKPAKKEPLWRHQGPTRGWRHHGPAQGQHQPLQHPLHKHEPIWSRPTRPTRGQRPSLARDQIVRAAVEFADAEGLEALSMRRLATKLGAGAMSLYWHVPTKEDLLDLMLDAGFGEVALPERPSGDWRADLRLFASSTRQTFRRHPWLATLIGGRPHMGPNALRYIEFCLSAMDGLGLDGPTVGAILNTVDAYVDGFVQREVMETETYRRTGLSEAEWQEAIAPYLQEILSSGRYPAFARFAAEAPSVAAEFNADATFEFGLECVLDGIAARIAATDGK